jgi:hypothetical protein
MPRKPNTNLLKSTLAGLLDRDQPATKAELGISDYYIGKLLGASHLKIVGTRKNVNPETGEADRGHPANLYGLTPNGRKVAKRFAARNAQTEGETATA